MESLPLEIRRCILEHSSQSEVKSLRLASSSWAQAGLDFLDVSNFYITPFRDESIRLAELSRHHVLAHKVEKMEFRLGEVNEYQARHNSYFLVYLREPEDRDRVLTELWQEYRSLAPLREKYEHKCCDSDTLTIGFKGFPKLRSISVNTSHCPYTSELWRKVVSWTMPSTRELTRREVILKFSNIFVAAKNSNISSLSHDQLPLEFWERPYDVVEGYVSVFRRLTTLKLVLRVPKSAIKRAVSNFAQCLTAAENLESLSLDFSTDPRMPAIFALMTGGDYVWHRLHTICLDNAVLQERDLFAFLFRHKLTLKRLSLGVKYSVARNGAIQGGIHMTGGIEDLCTRLQGFSLEKFNTRPYYATSDSKLQEGNVALYDDDWNRTASEIEPPSAAVERYVLQGGPWPGPRDWLPLPGNLTAPVIAGDPAYEEDS